jgi:RND family efflux transporter MFP subunit
MRSSLARQVLGVWAGFWVLLFPLQARPAAFDCLIEPMQVVEVSAPVVGLLDKVHVRRGDRVTKGQVVATLESRAEQAAADLARYRSQATGPTLSAQNRIEFAGRKFQRRATMAGEKLMSPQERDDAEAEVRLAEAELQTAKENRELAAIEHQQQSSLLELRTLRSPFDGVVADQLLYPGEVVEPTGGKKTILKLAQLDPLRVHVILPMAAFRRVTPGMSVRVTLEPPIGGSHAARVKTIDRLIDAASGTFAVFLEMRNPELSIPAGVKCRAEFPIETRK